MVPRVRRESFDERREFILDLPKRTESRFFEGSGATSERDGGRRMYVGHMGGHLSEDLIDGEGSMGHDAAGGSSGAQVDG